jgi:RNA polymerase sigma-70 factor, ECF subfamily
VEFFSFDADYLRRLETQDSATEEHFVAYFTSRLLRSKFSRRGVPADLVDDLVHDTLMRAIQKVRGRAIRQPEALGKFVSTTGDNVWNEFRRNPETRPRENVDGIDLAANGPGPEEMLRQKDVKSKVLEVLKKLPPRDQSILRGLFLEEKDKDVICKEFGIDRVHLRLIVHRALLKARKCLDQLESGNDSKGNS